MVEDLNLKFQAKKKELELALNQLEKFGINTEQYRKGLQEVEKAWEAEQAKSYGPIDYAFPQSSLAQTSNMASSSKYIKKILSIYQNLTLLFNEYIQMFYSCEALEQMLDTDKIFSITEIDNMAKEIIINLRRLSQSSNMDWQAEKGLVNKIMDLAYKIMKLEMLTKNDSLVFTVIQQQLDMVIPFMSDRILLDITDLKQDPVIQIYANKAQSQGLGKGYFEKDLIREVSKYVYSSKQLKEFEKDFKQLEQKLKDIQDRQTEALNKKDKIEKASKRFNKNFLISVALMAGLFAGRPFVLNRLFGPTLYKTEKTTYTDKNGSVKQRITYEEEQPRVIAKVYHPWQGFSRIIDTYDLSDFTYDDLPSYTTIDLSSLSKYQTVQKTGFLSEVELQEPLYTEYILAEQDKKDVKYGKAEMPLWLDIINVTAIILGLLIELALLVEMSDEFKLYQAMEPLSKEDLLKIKKDAEILKKLQSEYDDFRAVMENSKSKSKK